jgi:AcrR family transcriptional regulator
VGALFRHFETMGDFMAVTASEVLRRQLESFTKQVASIPADQPALEAALTVLRDITSGPTHAVLYEVMIAARTYEKLRDTLRHELEQYSAKMYDTARSLPGAESFPEEAFPVLIALLANVFDGAAVVDMVLPQPEIAERRVAVLAALLKATLPDAGS